MSNKNEAVVHYLFNGKTFCGHVNTVNLKVSKNPRETSCKLCKFNTAFEAVSSAYEEGYDRGREQGQWEESIANSGPR